MRDTRNGYSIPPQLTAKTSVNAIPRPQWWINFLTTRKLEFASLSDTAGTVSDLISQVFDPTITRHDLSTIREMWPGNIVVKGIQTLCDAKNMVDAGVASIVLSNLGGRQLDSAPTPSHLLPEVGREAGDATANMMDTGVMNGADLLAGHA